MWDVCYTKLNDHHYMKINSIHQLLNTCNERYDLLFIFYPADSHQDCQCSARLGHIIQV